MSALPLSLAVVLAVGWTTPAVAQDGKPLTREEALSQITAPDVETRRRATVWMGEVGTTGDLPAVFRLLRDPDDLVRALTENAIWQIWSRSGDPAVDQLFAVGVEQMNHGEAQAAIATFSEIIRRKPEFAEGWNKRATMYFLVGEYDKSLQDCDEVIKRNPQHWGVLSGYGQIYVQLDKPEEALVYFQRALAVNPNLRQVERMIEQLKQIVIEKRKGTI